MKKYVFILLLSTLSFSVLAQKEKGKSKGEDKTEKAVDYSKNVATVNNVIKSLYHSISGEKEEERNWKLFNFLFHSDAKLITAGRNNERAFQVKTMSTSDYIKTSGKWMEANGFIEKEISRKSEIYGRMAHVFSTYEAYNSKTDEEPSFRGINSIQLVNDGERWYILNLYWTQENWMYPIPAKYLN